jgi:DNA-binding CsgD family transcriptional regulator
MRTSANEMSLLCEPIKRYFGATFFSYILFYPPNIRIELSMSPSGWIDHYYQHIEDYHTKALKANPNESYSPGFYTWDRMPNRQPLNRDMVNYFNISNLVMLYKMHDDHTECCHFGSTADNYKAQQLFVNHRDLLERFIEYFRERAQVLIKKAKLQPILIPDQYKRDFSSAPPIASSFDREAFINSTRILTPSQQLCEIPLSKRETESLRLYTQGKTAKEIGKILQLSNRTIENYLRTIKNKFGVTSKAALIHKTWNRFK